MSDDFTREKMAWLEQVHSDSTLSLSCFHVAFCLAGYFNRETREAWPAQDTIATDCRLTRSGVRKALYSLRDAGHLQIDAGQGRHVSSRYRWLITERRGSERRHTRGTLNEKAPHTGHLTDAKSAPYGNEKCPIRSKISVPPVATNTLKEPFEEHVSRSAEKVSDSDTPQRGEIDAGKSPSSEDLLGEAHVESSNAPASRKLRGQNDTDLAIAFERFRAAYPRRPGSNWTKARESFDRAVKRGVKHDEIIAGATAYAGYCAREGNVGDRARFIKLPVTWLNQSEWTADYAPASATEGPRPAGGSALGPEQWRIVIARFRNTGSWPPTFGPRPGAAGCAAPPAILAEFHIGAAP